MTDGDRRVSLAILDGTFNRLRDPLHVVACWSLGGSAFAFDRKYIARSQQAEFRRFAQVRTANPMAPVALFGHTDVAGKVTHNHELSWGRAEAVYGVLVNEPDIWITLYKDDREELDHLKQRLVGDGYEIDPKEKGLGATTTEAIAAHLSHLAGDLKLDPYDFLGEHGQYSMQACSEFNPLRRVSRSLADKLTPEQRAAAERTNRRVVAFFFEPGTHVDGWWPCPKPGTGPAKCGKRLWSNAKTRRSADDPSREFFPKGAQGKPFAPIVRAHDTFECRFYERIAFDSPCERAEVWKPPKDPDPPPPPPPPLPPEDDDDDPPEPPKDPVDWTIFARCGHPDHFSSTHLGREAPGGHDTIDVVPGDDPDFVDIKTDPETEVDWVVGSRTTTGTGTAVGVRRVDAGSPSLRELYRWSPTVHLVQATKDGAQRALHIAAYPDFLWSYDLEKVRSKLRDEVLNTGIEIWRFVGDIAAEKFELDLLEKKDFSGTLALRWKEYPGDSGKGKDWRAFPSFFLTLRADPLIRLAVEMEFSLAKILKKLRKVKWAKRFFEWISPKLLKKLEAIKLVGEIEMEGGGTSTVFTDRPAQRIPAIGVASDPASKRVEIDGGFVWTGTGEADLAELTSIEDAPETAVSVSVQLGITLTVGLILDVDAEKFGAYVEGTFHGASITLHGELGPFEKEWTGDVLEPTKIERREFSLPFPEL